MKTIFRYTNVALVLAAFIALGAVAGMAQNPCEDADGITSLGDKFRADFALKTIEARKTAIDEGKQFLEKYGACTSVEAAKDLIDYLKEKLPGIEKAYLARLAAEVEAKDVAKFNDALLAKKWDDVYPAGKDLLSKYGDKYIDVELVLGTIGYDESYNNKNFKYNDDTLTFAKKAIADLEAGKAFSAKFGIPTQFVYNSKDNAIGWMNLAVGYINQVAKKDKKAAQSYLFNATQANSDTKKNAVPYELIGAYYFDQYNTLSNEIKTMPGPVESDTIEAAKAKADAIKEKVALANGTLERAIDAYARAYTVGVGKEYKDRMYKNVGDAYNVRFGKKEGIDTWVAETVKKPFINPTTPVTPIFDPEPAEVKTTGGIGAANGTGVGAANGTGIGAANGTGVGAANGSGVTGTKPVNNTTTTTTKPAATPTKAPVKKPQASLRKPAGKKKRV